MNIEYLADYPDFVYDISPWLHKQWGHHNNEKTVEDRIQIMKHRMNKTEIPICLVAFDKDKVYGTASLVENDMFSRPDLTPWLATLFVLPEYRKKGIGKKLVDRVIQEARLLDYKTLYLCTPDQEKFYTKLGWITIGYEENHGEKDYIMKKII